MKVLVVGSGAREHAIVRSIALDPSVDAVIAAPGNPGIEAVARCEPLPGGVSDATGVVALAVSLGVDLVVIGPEAPLVAGVADAVRAAGIAVLRAVRGGGPARGEQGVRQGRHVRGRGADRHGPRLHHRRRRSRRPSTRSAPPTSSRTTASPPARASSSPTTGPRRSSTPRACLAKPDGAVVIEEYLAGPEVSLFCLSDGTTVVPLSPAQDFKRVGDDDAGPNTGGMGAYSPLDWAPEGLVDDVVARVAQPVVDEMHRRGTPFAGVLYVGPGADPARPAGHRVQRPVRRPRDPGRARPAAHAAGRGAARRGPGAPARGPDRCGGRDEHAVTVVVAAENYPGTPRTGDPITGLDDLPGARRPTCCTPAPRATPTGALVSAGGRVLSVVATGATLAEARERVYAAVDGIDLPGSHHRTDIALRAERGEVTA